LRTNFFTNKEFFRILVQVVSINTFQATIAIACNTSFSRLIYLFFTWDTVVIFLVVELRTYAFGIRVVSSHWMNNSIPMFITFITGLEFPAILTSNRTGMTLFFTIIQHHELAQSTSFNGTLIIFIKGMSWHTSITFKSITIYHTIITITILANTTFDCWCNFCTLGSEFSIQLETFGTFFTYFNNSIILKYTAAPCAICRTCYTSCIIIQI
jgi:hypothetical protein